MKELLAKIKSYSPQADLKLVEKAYLFAHEAHKEHRRLSGEPYIVHPLAVANTVADLQQDHFTVAAALLHDVLEDADVTQEELEKLFGSQIVKMVSGVTKLGQLTFISREVRQAENFRKMFVPGLVQNQASKALTRTMDLNQYMTRLWETGFGHFASAFPP